MYIVRYELVVCIYIILISFWNGFWQAWARSGRDWRIWNNPGRIADPTNLANRCLCVKRLLSAFQSLIWEQGPFEKERVWGSLGLSLRSSGTHRKDTAFQTHNRHHRRPRQGIAPLLPRRWQVSTQRWSQGQAHSHHQQTHHWIRAVGVGWSVARDRDVQKMDPIEVGTIGSSTFPWRCTQEILGRGIEAHLYAELHWDPLVYHSSWKVYHSHQFPHHFQDLQVRV